MHRIIILLLVLCIPAQAETIISEEINYAYSYAGSGCHHPANDDRWGIREPNQSEILEYGNGILIFEYWNSKEKCSDDVYLGITFNNYRFKMEVVTGGQEDPREKITLQTMETPYYLPKDRLILDDGEKPGKLILYPLLM